MIAKVHLHMHVSDLAKSRAFYEKFLGGGPVKVKPGYVKFLPDWAPVNLALSEGGTSAEGTVNHVGVQVDARMVSGDQYDSYGVVCRVDGDAGYFFVVTADYVTGQIDKANREVLMLLLQVLEEGRLTDGKGRHIDFSNAVVVLTTNLGAEAFTEKAKTVGFGAAAQPARDSDAASGCLRSLPTPRCR